MWMHNKHNNQPKQEKQKIYRNENLFIWCTPNAARNLFAINTREENCKNEEESKEKTIIQNQLKGNRHISALKLNSKRTDSLSFSLYVFLSIQ